MKRKMPITKFNRTLTTAIHLATLGKEEKDMQRVLYALQKKATWLSGKLAKRANNG